MTEAKFVLSFDFTTVRGDTYEEFVYNCQQAFGQELGKTVVAVAMSNLAQHYTGQPTVKQAEQTLVNTLGAQQIPTEDYRGNGPGQEQQYQQHTQPQYQAVPQPGFQQQQQQQPAIGVPYPGDCAHGPRKFVPAGVSGPNSRNPGKPFPAFWSCQAPQGQPKCRG